MAPKRPSEVISSAFQLYGTHWKQMIGLGLAYVLVLFLVGLLVGMLFRVFVSGGTAAVVVGIISLGLFLVAAMALAGAVTRLVASDIAGQPIQISDSLKWGFAHLGGILLISVLEFVIFLAIGLVIFLFVALIVGSGDNASLGGALLIILVGYLFMAFVGVTLSMAVPAYVVENTTGTSALRRSWELVTKHFWHALGTLALGYLVLFVVSIIVGIIGSASDVLRQILSFVVEVAFVPFYALVLVLLYVNLRVKSGGVSQETIRDELARHS